MPTLERSTIDGTGYRLISAVDVTDISRPMPVGLWCGAEVELEGVPVLLKASGAYSCRASLDDFGASFTTEYSIGSGALHVGSYSRVDETFAGEQLSNQYNVCYWEAGPIGLFAESDRTTGEWLAELLAEAQPATVNDSPVLTRTTGLAFGIESRELVLTLYGRGVAELMPIDRAPQASGPGLPTAAGIVYRDTSVPDAASLVLETDTAFMRLSMLQTGVDQGAFFMADDIMELSFTLPGGPR